MKWAGFLSLAVALVLISPAVSANQISEERMEVDLALTDWDDVVVERTYEHVSSQRISYLVPARYEPREMRAYDEYGEIDCQVDELEVGSEILCFPRERSDYTVRIEFKGEFVDRNGPTYTFSYAQRVLTPTRTTSMSVTLPEGFGLLSGGEAAYQPEDANVGSEGRKIFLTWNREDVSIGDTTLYQVKYEELQVFERMSARMILGILVVLGVVGAAAYRYRRRPQDGSNMKTIAAVFPVLKDDEQQVLRYIIDHEGEVEQRDIVENVEYSKAKISKLLSDLEERNLVEKEKQGRVNIVSLKREVGDFSDVDG